MSDLVKQSLYIENLQDELQKLLDTDIDVKTKADIIMKIGELTVTLNQLIMSIPEWVNYIDTSNIKRNVNRSNRRYGPNDDPLGGLTQKQIIENPDSPYADYSEEAKF
jgi:hypothetical protein